MPEGPEVRIISKKLDPFIGFILKNSGYIGNPPKGYTQFVNKPWILDGVFTKGKLIRLDFSNSNDKISMLSSLGLEGRWSDTKSKHTKFWLQFYNKTIYYNDSRNFGKISFVPVHEADKKFEKLGWDMLVNPMPQNKWMKLKKNRWVKNLTISNFLLKQKYISGVGNIYRAEVLYLTNLPPFIKIKDIDDEKWKELNHKIHLLLNKAYLLKGSSIKSFTGGSFQKFLTVYRKKSCPKNHKVMKTKSSNRTIWYCPQCQSTPSKL